MLTACVPLSADAVRRLDTDSCLPGDLYEVMLSDATVDLLFDSGFLTTLNTRFGLVPSRAVTVRTRIAARSSTWP